MLKKRPKIKLLRTPKNTAIALHYGMFQFFRRKAKTPAFESVVGDLAKFVVAHFKARFEEAAIPVGEGSPLNPLVIDTRSRGDLYLMGYATGWCEVIEKQAPTIDSRDKYNIFYSLTMLALFGARFSES